MKEKKNREQNYAIKTTAKQFGWNEDFCFSTFFFVLFSVLFMLVLFTGNFWLIHSIQITFSMRHELKAIRFMSFNEIFLGNASFCLNTFWFWIFRHEQIVFDFTFLTNSFFEPLCISLSHCNRCTKPRRRNANSGKRDLTHLLLMY